MGKNKKIFLTGGTGFVGKNFIAQALQQGFEIVAQKLPDADSGMVDTKGLIWVPGYYDDDWTEYLSSCDVLVHLAAHSANPPYDTLEECLKQNVVSPLELFNQALACGINNYLLAGTSFEYGLSGSEYEYIPIVAPLLPSNSYSTSKAAMSVVFSGWSIMNNVKLKYMRLFQVYGEGEPEFRLWPSLRKAAISGADFDLTPGEQVRDFIQVEDVVRKIIEQLDFSNLEKGVPQFMNIGSGNPMTIKEFAEYWWKEWKAQGKLNFGVVPYRENEVMRFVPEEIV